MRKVFTLLLLSALSALAAGQPLSSRQLDRLVKNAMKGFNVPGIAVAVVKDDQVIHMKGYGVRSIATGKKTDEHTLFAIASNTKAFTTAALAILVDEERLSWETKVIDIIPEFRLYNAYVTEDFTILDLLSHRSGLGEGAGDLMSWPDSARFTTADIIHNLRYLKQTSPFRTKYDYDNLLYIVAGEVVARVSGQTWEEFVESRIMKPLGMNESSASIRRIRSRANIIDAHVPVDGKLQVVAKQEGKIHNSVGGIYSNASDLSKWVTMQLNRGRYGTAPDEMVFSEETHKMMWTPQTVRPVSTGGPFRSNFAFYGLGWHLTDFNGYLQVYHTGSHAGIETRVSMLPEINLGIIVLTNQQSTEAHLAIANAITESYIGTGRTDWVKILKERALQEQAEAAEITRSIWATVDAQQGKTTKSTDHHPIAGTYRDVWFGDVTISSESGRLRILSGRSPKLKGELFHYKANTYIVKWDDRSMNADAFVVFALDRDGKPASFTMEAISPLTDFSFDFQDLYLVKRKN